MTDDLIIEQFRVGPLWNFSYIVGSHETREAVIIDPGAEIDTVLSRVEVLGLRVVAAVATHFHTDHTAGLATAVERTGATALLHHADVPGVRRHYHGPLRATTDGDRLPVGRQQITMWHAPGHTPGSQWLLVDGVVFTGDMLMVGAVGRTGFEDDAAEQMWRTFRERFPLLADETRVYPGHDYGPTRSSTVRLERQRLPCLRARSLDEFLACIERG